MRDVYEDVEGEGDGEKKNTIKICVLLHYYFFLKELLKLSESNIKTC